MAKFERDLYPRVGGHRLKEEEEETITGKKNPDEIDLGFLYVVEKLAI